MTLFLASETFLLVQERQQGSPIGSLLLFVPLILVFWFMIMRPQQRRAKEQQQLLRSVKQGDRVVAAGGIVGTVRRVDDDTISLQVADNVVIKVDRGSVAKKLSEA